MSRENTVPLVDDFNFVRSKRLVAEPAGMRG